MASALDKIDTLLQYLEQEDVVRNVSERHLMAWIRSQWTVGSRVEVFSKLSNEWMVGDVDKLVSTNRMEVQYATKSNQSKMIIRSLAVERDDVGSIRPCDSMMNLYEQIYVETQKGTCFENEKCPLFGLTQVFPIGFRL